MTRKPMTRADLFVLGGLILLCALLFLVHRPKTEGDTVFVYVENELRAEFSLKDAPSVYTVTTERGSLTLSFDGKGVSVERSDCPDAVCRRMGQISLSGESIVCAPLGVCVTVEGGTLDGVTG